MIPFYGSFHSLFGLYLKPLHHSLLFKTNQNRSQLYLCIGIALSCVLDRRLFRSTFCVALTNKCGLLEPRETKKQEHG